MGVTSAWAISAHDDAFIAHLAPRLLPLIEAAAADPSARGRWRRWQENPLPDHRTWRRAHGGGGPEADAVHSFHELTSVGEHLADLYGGAPGEEGFWLVEDVWERAEDPERMFLSIHTKEYAVSALFHAIGPRRAALLPGWCGNFLLSSAEVQEALPRVERALTFTPGERAVAERRIWLDHRPGERGEESLLDGPLRQLRQAAEAGLGVCGVAVHIY
ncbi:hypothetical protein [Streptomyces sp. NPDC059092]|uniref:hypothetical protein n=1 Tax=Streptomyces sp. NPDC059092 TaxID=3346725 RepID=UPI00369B6AB7